MAVVYRVLEHVRRLDLARGNRELDGRFSGLVAGAGISAKLQEQVHDWREALLRCGHERTPSIIARKVDVSAVLQQHSSDLSVPARACCVSTFTPQWLMPLGAQLHTCWWQLPCQSAPARQSTAW